jgi:CheY-like chemotaxis protein
MSSHTTSAKENHRILLVDDNRMGLAARKTVLEELGFPSVGVNNPEDAIARFSEQKFSLVVTDYRMPKMNGVELIRELRKRQPNIPVVLISGFVEALGLNEATTGADVVIAKSANEVAHLVRAVKRLVNRKPPKKPVTTEKPALKSKRARTS